MRRRLHIPSEVSTDIAEQLSRGVANTVLEFASAAEDEDTLTGHLGARLTLRSRKVAVVDDEIPGTWIWSLGYQKFRGRGPKATESYLGADGIFEFAVGRHERTDTKSILFQSKMAGGGGSDLVDQCAKLSTWREAAFVIVYAPDGISAVSIDNALGTKGIMGKAPTIPLNAFLSNYFVGCLVGDNDLRYISSTRTLVWRSRNDELVHTKFPLSHRFKIEVTPPNHEDQQIGRRVSENDIHKHRMDSTAEELLAREPGKQLTNPKAAQRALSKIYHPDVWAGFSDQTRELMQARMQEINNAYDQVSKIRTRK